MHACLPPKIDTEIQGRLDLIILRPILTPPLQPHQVLEFEYTWWGDDEAYKNKLYPGKDEVKMVFNICCDSTGFFRYLEDAERIDIKLNLANESTDLLPRVVDKVPFKCIRNKNEWKNGEEIGTISLCDLKFNSRGEYVYESKVVSIYGNVCGFVVVFMLYTPSQILQELSNSPERESSIVSLTGESNAHNYETPAKSKNYSISPTNPNYSSPAKEKNNFKYTTSPSKTRSLTTKLNDNLSPQFITIGNSKKRSANKHALQNKNIAKHATSPTMKKANDYAYMSDIELKEFLPDSSFLLTRLFSFVDSGAIHPSDLPTLIQICQGRSPSIDLSYDQLQENCSSVLKDLLSPEDVPVKNDQNLLTQDENKFHSPVTNLNGSIQSNLRYTFCSEYLEDGIKTPLNYGSCNPEAILANGLKASNVAFNSEEDIKIESDGEKLVRQRSRVCYLIQITLTFSDEDYPRTSCLFVSRQIEDGVVFFNEYEILQLPYFRDEELKGHINVKVIERKLGTRLGKEIGFGFVPLHDLLRAKGKAFSLPILADENGDAAVTGSIEMAVSFALKEKPDSHLPQQDVISHDTSNRTCHSERANKEEKEDLHFDKLNIHDEKVGDSGRMEEAVPFPSHPWKVHLEVLEGSQFPMLLSGSGEEAFAPNTYVRLCLPGLDAESRVAQNSTFPQWSFQVEVILSFDLMERVNYQLLLLILHCPRGSVKQKSDPVLGFATLDVQLWKRNPTPVLGWIPVLNKDGGVCGDLKVSLTPITKEEEGVSSKLNKEMATQTSQSLIYQKIDAGLPIENQQLLLSSKDEYPRVMSKHTKCNVSEYVLERPISKHSSDIPTSPFSDRDIPPDRRDTSSFSVSQPYQKMPTNLLAAHPGSQTSNYGDSKDVYRPAINDRTFIICGESPLSGERGIVLENVSSQTSSVQTQMQLHYGGGSEVTVPSVVLEKQTGTTHYASPMMETYAWMNQLEFLDDTPCVSYIEEYPGALLISNKASPVMEHQIVRKRKVRKSRIAANINLIQ